MGIKRAGFEVWGKERYDKVVLENRVKVLGKCRNFLRHVECHLNFVARRYT